MIKKILAATVLVFGLGINGLAAQEVIKGPVDFERLAATHGVICANDKAMDEFFDDEDMGFYLLFRGKNDMLNLSKDKTKIPSTSTAGVFYSDKLKTAITVVYDRKENVACVLTGVKDVEVYEDGVNATLGYKH